MSSCAVMGQGISIRYVLDVHRAVTGAGARPPVASCGGPARRKTATPIADTASCIEMRASCVGAASRCIAAPRRDFSSDSSLSPAAVDIRSLRPPRGRCVLANLCAGL